MTARYFCGLDLGQTSDHTALAIVGREPVSDVAGDALLDHRGQPPHHYECVHIERFALGTPYPVIVAQVKTIMGRRELRSGSLKTHVAPVLAVDATGVGRAVVDLFIDARMPCDLVPVTITGGTAEPRRDCWSASGGPTAWWTPKKEIAGAVQAALSSKRLKIAPRLPLADLTRQELYGFHIKNTPAGNETFNAREGVHDDLVLAVALAVWLAGQPLPPCFAIGKAVAIPLDDRGPCAYDRFSGGRRSPWGGGSGGGAPSRSLLGGVRDTLSPEDRWRLGNRPKPED